MPPAGKKRPDEATYNTLLSGLEGSLEKLAAQHPQPGRIDTLRRLNRTEYRNAIRDLLALDIDAAALLVYRAAWLKDSGAPRVTREAAMAKLFATDQAQKVIDTAVQLHGGDGVRSGSAVETLYREIRALRIYEGASDVQRVVIARQTLAQHHRG